MKLTASTAQALTNLRGNRDFVAFMEGVKEYEAELTTRCVDGSGEAQLRAAGGVQVLRALGKSFADAPVTLQKFKTPNQQVK